MGTTLTIKPRRAPVGEYITLNESGAHCAKPVDLLVVARGPDGELAEALSKEFAVSSRMWAVLFWIAAIAFPWLVAGIITARNEPKKWLDLFQTEGRPDLTKVQMALFTTLAAIFVTAKIYGTLEFPELPAGLLTLIGISNGVYLGAKATS